MGVRLIAPDRPGIGLSDFQPGCTLRDWTADVEHLADSLGLERFPILGWSSGGVYVWACAFWLRGRVIRAASCAGMAPLDRPGAAARLGLIADRLLFPLSRRAPVLAELLLWVAKHRSAESLKRELLRDVGSAADQSIVAAIPAEVLAAPLMEALRPGVRGVVQDYRVTGGPWGFDVAGVETPVELWHGLEDRLAPVQQAVELARSAPCANLRELAGCGHFLLHTQLDAVLRNLTGAA